MLKNNFLLLGILISTISFTQTKISMSKEGGVYTVPCKVNGLPLKFIFDTGASNVSISLTEALFMIKNGYLNKKDIGESVYYSIANGDVARGTKLNIKEIEFAGLKLYNVEASIVHETTAPLLLGQSVIGKLGKIQLDGNELTILNEGNNSYDYSNSSYASNNSTTNSYSAPYSNSYSGTKAVFTYSPITDKPGMGDGEKQIGAAENNSVFLIEKYSEKFYKVKSGNTIGYLWSGWFKD